MKKIKLLILDVDGVMTDGTKTYDLEGNVISKRFADLDFTAIKRILGRGVNVCWLSSDSRVNKKVALSRGIDFHLSRTKDGKIDKRKFIKIFSEIYDICDDEMAYVGDDWYDVPIMQKVGLSYCPSNSPNIVKNVVNYVLNSRSGQGVISELLDYWIETGVIVENEQFDM
ncbi:hypothetical protein CL614_09020 [archaeon]|nr:hypothetical protein [archaeon]